MAMAPNLILCAIVNHHHCSASGGSVVGHIHRTTLSELGMLLARHV